MNIQHQLHAKIYQNAVPQPDSGTLLFIGFHQKKNNFILNEKQPGFQFFFSNGFLENLTENQHVIKEERCQISNFIPFFILYPMLCARGLHHFSFLSYLSFKKIPHIKISKSPFPVNLRVRNSNFFSKCSPLSSEYTHIIGYVLPLLGFSKKSFLVDHWVQKLWFSRKQHVLI